MNEPVFIALSANFGVISAQWQQCYQYLDAWRTVVSGIRPGYFRIRSKTGCLLCRSKTPSSEELASCVITPRRQSIKAEPPSIKPRCREEAIRHSGIRLTSLALALWFCEISATSVDGYAITTGDNNNNEKWEFIARILQQGTACNDGGSSPCGECKSRLVADALGASNEHAVAPISTACSSSRQLHLPRHGLAHPEQHIQMW